MAESTTVDFTRDIPVRHTVDVFVAGGGPAGVAASVAAARQGAKVFQIEAQNCFGGMGTSGGLSMIVSFSDGVNFVAGGVGRDVYDELLARNATVPPSKPGNRDLYYRPEALKRIYDDLVVGAGVDFTFNTHMIGVEAADGRVRHVICFGKSGLFAVRAKAFVDATGDGDLCAWAGAPFQKGDEEGNMQSGSLLSLWSNVNWQEAEAAGNGLWQQDGRLREAIRDGLFTAHDSGMPGIIRSGDHTGNGNIGHLFGVDGTDERTVTKAAIWGRKMMPEYERYFKEYLTGYKNMEHAGSAAVVGIRESRRIMGDYVLVVDDYIRRANFEDEIGRFSYTVDTHATKLTQAQSGVGDFERLKFRDGESYGIPYRVLTPRTLDNVLVAGRCVSTDRKVQGSLRVMPGCFITGQAAGIAAAMTVEKSVDTRSIGVPELQRRLKAVGVYLPNCK